jgi:hypothetical protein
MYQLQLAHDEFLHLEKYKLNIYNVGDFLKAHGDTPRSLDFMGTLVVCLPSKFEGGVFHLENNIVQAAIDWSPMSSSLTQWAFFHGDTKHWIDEVSSGWKGVDKVMALILNEEGFETRVGFSYLESETCKVFIDRHTIPEMVIDGDIFDTYGGINGKQYHNILWIDPSGVEEHREAYIYYGNEHSLGYVYESVLLMVKNPNFFRQRLLRSVLVVILQVTMNLKFESFARFSVSNYSCNNKSNAILFSFLTFTDSDLLS